MTEDEIRQIFSRNLKNFRSEKKLSQMALAEKADVAQNFINDIENCKKWISPSTLSKLCTALNIMPYQLFLPMQTKQSSASEIIQQFSSEVINSIVSSVNEISKRY